MSSCETTINKIQDCIASLRNLCYEDVIKDSKFSKSILSEIEDCICSLEYIQNLLKPKGTDYGDERTLFDIS